MIKSKVLEFLRALGVPKFRENEDWIQISCPLAPWTHETGKDKHPSAGILSTPDRSSIFQCFTCHPNPSPLLGLVMMLWAESGDYPREAAKLLLENEVFDNEVPTATQLSKAPYDKWLNYKKIERPSMPQFIIDRFPLLMQSNDAEARNIRNYLVNKRGIELEFIAYNSIRYDSERGLIVFPLTDIVGNIQVLQARRWRDKKIFSISPKVADRPDLVFPSLRKDGPWFGMHHINPAKPVICVEGPLDSLRLQSLGYYNTIASCGAGVTLKQLHNIPNNNIILGYDSDRAGKEATKRIVSLLENRLVQRLDWGLVGKKDAGDLTSKEELEDVLNNREVLA